MSSQRDRYLAAVCLAQMILEEPAGDDGRLVAEAVAFIQGEVEAGRKNQDAFPVVTAELFERLANPKPRMYAVPDPPESLAVREPVTGGWSVRVPREGQ